MLIVLMKHQSPSPNIYIRWVTAPERSYTSGLHSNLPLYVHKYTHSWAVVEHAFIPSIWKLRQEDVSEFGDSLVYRVSSRTARTVKQRNYISKNQKKVPTHIHINKNIRTSENNENGC